MLVLLDKLLITAAIVIVAVWSKTLKPAAETYSFISHSKIVSDCCHSFPFTSIVASSSNCHDYFICYSSSSGILKQSCGFLLFNPISLECDWPANVINLRPECQVTYAVFDESDKRVDEDKLVIILPTAAANDEYEVEGVDATTVRSDNIKHDIVTGATSSSTVIAAAKLANIPSEQLNSNAATGYDDTARTIYSTTVIATPANAITTRITTVTMASTARTDITPETILISKSPTATIGIPILTTNAPTGEDMDAQTANIGHRALKSTFDTGRPTTSIMALTSGDIWPLIAIATSSSTAATTPSGQISKSHLSVDAAKPAKTLHSIPVQAKARKRKATTVRAFTDTISASNLPAIITRNNFSWSHSNSIRQSHKMFPNMLFGFPYEANDETVGGHQKNISQPLASAISETMDSNSSFFDEDVLFQNSNPALAIDYLEYADHDLTGNTNAVSAELFGQQSLDGENGAAILQQQPIWIFGLLASLTSKILT